MSSSPVLLKAKALIRGAEPINILNHVPAKTPVRQRPQTAKNRMEGGRRASQLKRLEPPSPLEQVLPPPPAPAAAAAEAENLVVFSK